MKQPPRISQSSRTKRWFLVSRYTVKEDVVIAHDKTDITDIITGIQKEALMELARRWEARPERRVPFRTWVISEIARWPEES